MLLLFIVIAAVIIVILEQRLTKNSLRDVEEDLWPDEKLVDPDEVFGLVFSARNKGKRYILFLKLEEQLPKDFILHGEDRHAHHIIGGGSMISFTTWLRPRQEVQFRVPISVSQRGVYLLNTLKVSVGDFLGLREEVRRKKLFRAVVAAPKEAPEEQISDVLGGFLGDVSVRRFIYEDPVLTAGFHEYTGREPMKSIAWNQSVRGQGLMVKKYDYTAEATVSVLLNVDSSVPEREAMLERCFSIARTVCRILEERGITYDFLTNADLFGFEREWSELGDGLGVNHFCAVLECLGRATYLTPFSGERLLERSLETGTSRGRILITPGDDFGDSHALLRLTELSGGNVLVIRAEEAAEW